MEKWREVYGTLILANLAYICAMIGNYTKARQHIADYLYLYGRSDFSTDPDEHQKMTYAQ